MHGLSALTRTMRDQVRLRPDQAQPALTTSGTQDVWVLLSRPGPSLRHVRLRRLNRLNRVLMVGKQGKSGWSATTATTGALEGVGEHVRVEVLTQPDYGGEIAEELPQTEISFPAGSAFAEKTLRITNRPPDLMSRRHPLAST